MAGPGRAAPAAVALALLVGGAGCGGDAGGGPAAVPRPVGAAASSTTAPGPEAPAGDPTPAPPPAPLSGSDPGSGEGRETIERQMVDEQRRRTPDLRVGAASCPDGAPEGEPGATATCTLDVEGLAVPFTVTLIGTTAQSAGAVMSYELRPTRPIVDVTAIVRDIRTQASTQLAVAADRIAVDCGPARVQLIDVGASITCTLDDGRATRRLAAVLADDAGSITIREI